MKLPKLFLTYSLVFLLAAGIGVCKTNSGASSEISSDNNTFKLMAGADIKALVQAQIDSAKAREFRGEIKSCMFQLDSKANLTNNLPKTDFETNSIEIKFLITIGFSITVFLIVFVRRKNLKNQESLKKKLKENIQMIREEGTIIKENPELNLIRSKLVNQSADAVVTSVSKKAKGLKIGKGEVMLAAKIKSYQLSHFISNNK